MCLALIYHVVLDFLCGDSVSHDWERHRSGMAHQYGWLGSIVVRAASVVSA